MIGNVVTYQNSGDAYAFLIVGNTQGDALLSVSGGSLLTTVSAGFWDYPFLLYLGGIPIAGGRATSGNRVMVSGTNSYLECLILRIGILGGSSNSVSVSDGAVLKTGVEDYDVSSYNSILVTDPGSLFQGSLSLASDHDSLRVDNGAHLAGSIYTYGRSAVILIAGTNSAVNGRIVVDGDQSSVVISNGAQFFDEGGGLEDFSFGGNNTFLIDGQGTYANVNGGVVMYNANDRLRISNGARFDASGGGGYGGTIDLGSASASNVVMTVTDPGTRLNIFRGPALGLSIWGPNSEAPGSTLIVSNAAVLVTTGDILLGGVDGIAGHGSALLVTGAGSQLLASDTSIWVGKGPGWPLGSANQVVIGEGGFAAASNVVIYSGNSASVAGNLCVTNSSQ